MISQVLMLGVLGLQTSHPVALAVVATDPVTHGQARYVEFLLSDLERTGRLRRVPAALDQARLRPCLDRLDPERCLRREAVASEPTASGFPLIVLGLAPEAPGEGAEPGTVRVYCLRSGSGHSTEKGPRARLWPGAEITHSVQPLERDLDALEACIEGARAE